MLIDNYRHIHIYENCSANMLSANFSIVMTSPIFLGDYKGAGAVSGPANKCDRILMYPHPYTDPYKWNLSFIEQSTVMDDPGF